MQAEYRCHSQTAGSADAKPGDERGTPVALHFAPVFASSSQLDTKWRTPIGKWDMQFEIDDFLISDAFFRTQSEDFRHQNG